LPGPPFFVVREPKRVQVGAAVNRAADVEAPDESSAIAKAIKEYGITEPWRQRSLLAKRYA
jgi:hypothetical protein